ncbi:MAG: c-type cytochrome [Flavobacteriaceae bacterium]
MRLFFILYLGIITSLGFLLFQDDKLEASINRGKVVYADFCVTCHLGTGEGVEETYPPLANSDFLRNNREKSIRGVKFGQRGEIVVNGVIYNNTMLPLGLEDEEIADVMNYINNSWGNKVEKMVTVEEVAAIGRR